MNIHNVFHAENGTTLHKAWSNFGPLVYRRWKSFFQVTSHIMNIHYMKNNALMRLTIAMKIIELLLITYTLRERENRSWKLRRYETLIKMS